MEEPAAESRAVVSDYGNQTRRHALQPGRRDAHEGEVLRDEHAHNAHHQDRGAGGQHAGGQEEQAAASPKATRS